MNKELVEICGYISSSLFALCAVPLAVDAIKKKSCDLPNLYLASWAIGEFFSIVYLLNKEDVNPLYCNAVIATINLSILIFYKLKPIKT